MGVARRAERIITLKDGEVIGDVSNGEMLALTALEQLTASVGVKDESEVGHGSMVAIGAHSGAENEDENEDESANEIP